MGGKLATEECKNNKLKDFILKSKEKFGDLYTYENAIYDGAHKKILITLINLKILITIRLF